jgi:hypothetical protein
MSPNPADYADKSEEDHGRITAFPYHRPGSSNAFTGST